MSTRPLTRKQRAKLLWARLNCGPSIDLIGRADGKMTPAEFISRYRGWAHSWVLVELAQLVPELKDKLDVLGNIKREESCPQIKHGTLTSFTLQE